ncbi:MAG TPA: WD40 repeat domain-containing serine/threonine-protein kinase [Phycisphaerales bacterium]|nr:WD40 repeat domain-containing serine/threonine-protein kinase [Phycisphaerales bacterium]HMP37271.1 WD40 repeat domain-containing serine/threonine-protein kinase [Phycisphaerales bacterium]
MREADALIAGLAARVRADPGLLDGPTAAPGRASAVGSGASTSSARSPLGGDPRPESIRDDFPGYAIASIISIGGQGVVYRARQLSTGRPVAIKVPLGDAVSRPARRYRFRREVELTARLDHPNIVRVLGDCAAPDGRVGCVMELVDGERFDEWAAREREHGVPGRRRIVEAVRRIAEAIAYAHIRGVLHRDLKPGNVLVTPDGQPRVLDFGLAKALGEGSGSFATVTGAFLGTLAHAAPEQVDGRRDGTDIRTDVHGLGLLLHVGLAGRLPWDARLPPPELIARIREGALDRPTADAPPSDHALDAIILKALAKPKERRYATAGDLADDLGHWLEGAPVRARFDSRTYLLRATAWRHRVALTIATLFVLIAAVIVTLAISARASVRRAEISARLRSAGAVEAHWATVADLRSTSRDNFLFGERQLWDLLIAPDDALRGGGLDGDVREGGGALGAGPPTARSVPTSPVYWALWEAYMRTPVVASLPIADAGFITFARHERSPTAVICDGDVSSVRFWDWRRGEIVARVALPEGAWGRDFATRRAGRWLLAYDSRSTAALVDTELATLAQQWTASHADMNRTALGAGTLLRPDPTDPTGCTLELLDLREAGVQRRWSIVLDEAPSTIACDGSESMAALTFTAGELRFLSMRDGRELHRRCRDHRPHYRRVQSRGRPNELLAFGTAGHAFLRCDDWGVTFGPHVAVGADGVDGRTIRAINATPDNLRYPVVTERLTIAIGHAHEESLAPRTIPSLRGVHASISDDDRHLAARATGEQRCVVVDLDPVAIRRLRHAAPHTATGAGTGSATIFACRFAPDGSALFSVAMDGSVRRYDLSRESTESTRGLDAPRAERMRQHEEIEWFVGLDGTVIHAGGPQAEGLTRLAFDGADLVVGTHELGRNDARVLRLRHAAADRLEPTDGIGPVEPAAITVLAEGDRRWICGLVIEPGASIWTLAGDGRLTRFRADDDAVVTERRLARHSVIAGQRALARSAHRRLLLAGPSGAGVQVLDEASLEPIAPAVAMPPMQAIVVSPTDPDLFVTAHDDGVVRVWRLIEVGGSGGCGKFEAVHVRDLGSHAGPAMCAAFHPSGRLLATGGGAAESRDIRLWDIEHGRELAALSLFDDSVLCLDFSPDGRWLAAGGEGSRSDPDAGGLFYLVDLTAAEASMAGNLEYHIARWTRKHGGPPQDAERLRRRFGTGRSEQISH